MFRRTEHLRRFVAAGLASATLALSTFPFAAESSASNGNALASSKTDAANYTAEIAGSGSYKAGAEGTVTVTVTAKGEYHINPQYPYKFKTNAASDGLAYPKPTLQRGDGKFEETRGSFQVPFVAAKAGKVSVGGTFHLSVCSAANCVVDKVPLEIVVEVK